MHKIDRGARNLKDWADLRELSDAGIAVHFANESLDLHSRGGRLSADIQAVVAADYIYNLSEETKKGINGRLKQGLLPLGAPLGYLNTGPGKKKEIDPVRGPLIREAFEQYASGQHSLRSLAEYLYRKGLRNRTGRIVGVNSLSIALNNPFYMGLIRVKRRGETYDGIHEPLISPGLFEQVQAQLRSKKQTVVRTHDFLFRRMLVCGGCRNRLVGELQKGHAYYRCHTRTCKASCIREEKVELAIAVLLNALVFREEEKPFIESQLQVVKRELGVERDSARQTLSLRLRQVSDRLMKLTDAYLDGEIEKDLFEQRKGHLLSEKKEVEESVRVLSYSGSQFETQLRNLLELADTAWLNYFLTSSQEKRNLLQTLTSNIEVYGKNVVVKLSLPFEWIAERDSVLPGSPERDTSRSLQNVPTRTGTGTIQLDSQPLSLIDRLLTWIIEHPDRTIGY